MKNVCGLVDAVMANSSILGLMLKKKIRKKPRKRVIALIKARGKHGVAYVLTDQRTNFDDDRKKSLFYIFLETT